MRNVSKLILIVGVFLELMILAIFPLSFGVTVAYILVGIVVFGAYLWSLRVPPQSPLEPPD